MDKWYGEGNVPPPSRAWMVAGIAHGELSNDETEAGAKSLLWSVERGIDPQGNDPAGDWVWGSVDCLQSFNVRCTASDFPNYHINRRGRQRQTGS